MIDMEYREKVLNALKPIADVFNVDFDYIAEEKRELKKNLLAIFFL